MVKWSDATFVEDQDEWWHGGITRSVFLYATGRTHLGDIKAIAGLADDLVTGTLALDVRVAFEDDKPVHGWIVEAGADRSERRHHPRRPRTPLTSEASVTDEDHLRWEPPVARDRYMSGAAIGPAIDPHEVLLPVDGTASWHLTIPEVARWSAEEPTLYGLTVRSAPRMAMWPKRPTIPVGFRRVEIVGPRPPGQRRARPLPRRQPPRLQPVHRPDHHSATTSAPTSSR